MTNTRTTTDRPVKVLRSGRIQAAIWVRETGRGTTRHSISISRSFKRSPESPWEQSNSYSREEALVAARLLERAHDWINDEIAASGRNDDPDRDGTPIDADHELDRPTEQCPICKHEVPVGTNKCDTCGSRGQSTPLLAPEALEENAILT